MNSQLIKIRRISICGVLIYTRDIDITLSPRLRTIVEGKVERQQEPKVKEDQFKTLSSGKDWTGQGRPGHGRAGQEREGYIRTGQGRTWQDRTGEGRTGRAGRTGQRMTGQGKKQHTDRRTSHIRVGKDRSC